MTRGRYLVPEAPLHRGVNFFQFYSSLKSLVSTLGPKIALSLFPEGMLEHLAITTKNGC